MQLLLMQEFNLGKPWEKNQGIQPHVELMPPCGCIARLYRWQLVDGEFMHRNNRNSIVWYWRFGDEKPNQGGSVCRRSGFSHSSFDSECFNFFLPRGSKSLVLDIYGRNFITGVPNGHYHWLCGCVRRTDWWRFKYFIPPGSLFLLCLHPQIVMYCRRTLSHIRSPPTPWWMKNVICRVILLETWYIDTSKPGLEVPPQW